MFLFNVKKYVKQKLYFCLRLSNYILIIDRSIQYNKFDLVVVYYK